MSQARARGKRYETTLRARSIANLASLAPRWHAELAEPVPPATARERPSEPAAFQLPPASPPLHHHTEQREGGKPWIFLSS